ncbi:MAG: BlaI/MecI/CopY family transcriptional regulator [Microscillaceae bacterium]|nr:BlaI/MecI/CopY family transcriptional regulator [Microscillaceae bacterium]
MNKPTEAELEILRVLWQKGPATVRFVHEALNAQRPEDQQIGYTTTLKMMQLMTDKGLLNRDASQRTHIFKAELSEEATQKSLVERLLDTAFGGSAKKLVMQALGQSKTSRAELEEIKKLIQDMEKGESS